MNQSAPGQHGHGDGGHSHGCHGAEGEDCVVPSLAVLLLPGGTTHWGVLAGNSRLNRVFSIFLSKFSMYKENFDKNTKKTRFKLLIPERTPL